MDVFGTCKTGKEVAPSVGFFIVAERLEGTLQSTVGRLPANGVNDIVLSARHRERLPNRAASLTQSRNNGRAAKDGNGDGIDRLAIDERRNFIGIAPAGKTTDQTNPGISTIEGTDPLLDWKNKGIGHQDATISTCHR